MPRREQETGRSCMVMPVTVKHAVLGCTILTHTNIRILQRFVNNHTPMTAKKNTKNNGLILDYKISNNVIAITMTMTIIVIIM